MNPFFQAFYTITIQGIDTIKNPFFYSYADERTHIQKKLIKY